MLEDQAVRGDYFFTNPDAITLAAGAWDCRYSWEVPAGETMHFAGSVST